MTITRRSRPAPISDKTLRKRQAAGETRIYSTITPNPSVGSRPPSRKPIKKVNEERQARRKKEYRRKLAAFRRSPVYREVTERADGRCEGKFTDLNVSGIPTFGVIGARCEGTERLQVHHVGYQGFGGSERADKLVVLCSRCHAAIERHLRPWKRQQWKSSRFQFGGAGRGGRE